MAESLGGQCETDCPAPLGLPPLRLAAKPACGSWPAPPCAPCWSPPAPSSPTAAWPRSAAACRAWRAWACLRAARRSPMRCGACRGPAAAPSAAAAAAACTRGQARPPCVAPALLPPTCAASRCLAPLSTLVPPPPPALQGLAHLAALSSSLTALDLGYSCWSHTAVGLAALLEKLPGLALLNVGASPGAARGFSGTPGSLAGWRRRTISVRLPHAPARSCHT